VKDDIPKQTEVEDIARRARLNLAKDGYIAQVAFLWSGDRVAIIGGMPIKTNIDKEAWATILRRKAIEMKADTLLMIMEVWGAEVPTSKYNPDDHCGPVKEMQGAYEAVMFHIETMDGTWMSMTPIIKTEGQPKTFPMPRYWSQGKVVGTFANLLPDKNG
jgi:hypothetical protein